jgi:hypothetical protein
MKKLMFLCGVAILSISVSGMISPAYAQFDNEVQDLSNLLNGAGGGNNRGGNNNRNFPQIPVSADMYKEIVETLKKGKTPLEKAQEKPLKGLLDMEIVTLSDKIQLLRNNQNNNNQSAANNTGGRGTPQAANNSQPKPPTEQEIKIDTITSARNDDFIANKLPAFLTPEQVALVQKARAEDKANNNCLGGLLDRYFQQMQSSNNNNRGNNQNYNNNNNNQNNNQLRPNGQKYCMTIQVTPSERLEPIRKVLAKGNLPLAKDKEFIAETFMKAELKDLEDQLKAGLTSGNNNNNRGNNNNNNNNNNRNNDPRQIIQSSVDGMYKKVQDMLKPEQAATIKTWHYTQMLGRTPIDSLIAVNAMQDTPLTDAQITEVTAAWPVLRTNIQNAAKQAGKQVDAKTIDAAAMSKILEMLEPSQVASYQLAKKYGPEAAAGK